jgi:hypothetical protein
MNKIGLALSSGGFRASLYHLGLVRFLRVLVSLIVPMPHAAVEAYQRSHRVRRPMDFISQGSANLHYLSRLLERPMTPWTGDNPEELHSLDELDFKGFEVPQDSRVLDLREWNPAAPGTGDAGSFVYGYPQLKVAKLPENIETSLFRIPLLPTSPRRKYASRPSSCRPGYAWPAWTTPPQSRKVSLGGQRLWTPATRTK